MKLHKWLGWLRDLTPPNIDPAVLWGRPVFEPEDAEKVIVEICGYDLTESECYTKLLEWSRGSRATGKLGRDYQRYFEAQSQKVARLQRELGLEGIPLDPALADRLEELIRKGAPLEELLETLKSHFKLYYGDIYSPEELEREWAEVESWLKPRLQQALQKLQPIDWRDVLEPTILRPEDKYPWLRRYLKEFRADISRARRLITQLSVRGEIIIAGGAEAVKQETGLYVFKIGDIRAFKELGIEDPAQLYDALTQSRLFEVFRRARPEARNVVVLRYRDIDPNVIIDMMRAGRDKGMALYYTLDPLVCEVWTTERLPLLCNQWVFLMYYNPYNQTLYAIVL